MSTDPQNQYDDYRYNYRSSISITQAMHERLKQVVINRHDSQFNQSDAVREAIRFYLDNQEDLIGMRAVYAAYLGAVPRKLILNLDTIGIWAVDIISK